MLNYQQDHHHRRWYFHVGQLRMHCKAWICNGGCDAACTLYNESSRCTLVINTCKCARNAKWLPIMHRINERAEWQGLSLHLTDTAPLKHEQVWYSPVLLCHFLFVTTPLIGPYVGIFKRSFFPELSSAASLRLPVRIWAGFAGPPTPLSPQP